MPERQKIFIRQAGFGNYAAYAGGDKPGRKIFLPEILEFADETDA
jgi:hypothetical protein